jgi:hypothetical protein
VLAMQVISARIIMIFIIKSNERIKHGQPSGA